LNQLKRKHRSVAFEHSMGVLHVVELCTHLTWVRGCHFWAYAWTVINQAWISSHLWVLDMLEETWHFKKQRKCFTL